MDDGNDNSNSVEMIEVLDQTNVSEDKPILQLFKRLIGNSNQQNTVLTNAQIVDILEKEFKMDISACHELEIEIYLNIMKKFLKDWPQWDDFDSVINSLKNESEEFRKTVLHSKYHSLKEYLRKILRLTKDLTTESIDNISKTVVDQTEDKDVEMEVHCTREHLNELFTRWPHPEYNSIFYISNEPSKKDCLSDIKLESVLNWWNVSISINLWGIITFKKTSVHTLNHILVNKKSRSIPEPCDPLPQEIQYNAKRHILSEKQYYTKKSVIKALNKVLMEFNKEFVHMQFLNYSKIIMNFFLKDIELLHDSIGTLNMYRRYLSKYPYVRYLCSENIPINVEGKAKYDLMLQETVSPLTQFSIRCSSNKTKEEMKCITNWFSIECLECNIKFDGMTNLNSLLVHFREHHATDSNWKCTKCKQLFKMNYLTCMNWSHECKEEE